ncbi:MAG: right-handed parallel beta-helix repeat-containing protein, partial [Planctomycetota bacterium]
MGSNVYSKTAMSVGLALLVSSAAQAGAVLHVDDDAGLGGDGSSWPLAYKYLQDALANAVAGTEVRVAQGTYTPDQDEKGNVTPGDREATFQLINEVSLMGGYAGVLEPNPDVRDVDLYETILSGDLLGNDLPNFVDNDENSYNVVTGTGTDPTAELNGFTVTAGNANGPDPGELNWIRGAGMWTLAGSPTVADCKFDANSALWHGGGMYNHTGSSPAVTDSAFTRNRAVDFDGGGMFNFGGSSPTVTNCTFSRNSANAVDGVGGGMRNLDASSPAVDGCTFTRNTAGDGGGMINNGGSDPTVTNCTFSDNSVDPADGGGGGILNYDSDPVLDSCTFTGNSAWVGGGVYNSLSTGDITACTFDGNTALAGGG